MAKNITSSGSQTIATEADAIFIQVNADLTGNIVCQAGGTTFATITNPAKGDLYAYGGLRKQGAITINPSTTCNLSITITNTINSGIPGSIGPTGAAGAKGDKGDKGDTGAAGSGGSTAVDPSWWGIKAWNMPIPSINYETGCGNQTIHLMKVRADSSFTCAKALTALYNKNGSTAAYYIGLYGTDGTLLGSSANFNSTLVAKGIYAIDITASSPGSLGLTSGHDYYVALLRNGSGAAEFSGWGSPSGAFFVNSSNYNDSAGTYHYAAYGAGDQATLPASMTMANMINDCDGTGFNVGHTYFAGLA